MLSPFLFILYIGELTDMLDELGCHVIYVNEDAKNIMILLYPDATQAQKAILSLKRLQYKCVFLHVNVAIELFDKQILPILIYGSEIWGYEFSPAIENVQTSYLKKAYSCEQEY